MSFVTQNKVVLMYQPNGVVDGKGTGISPLSVDRHGMTGKTDNTIPGVSQVFGRDGWGRFRVKLTHQETPGGLNTGSVEWERQNTLDFFEERAQDQERFAIWEMYVPCARLDNPEGWLNGGQLVYRGKMFVTSLSEGDAPVREASGEPVVNNADVSWEYNIRLRPLALSNISPTNAENDQAVNNIAVLQDPNPDNCIPGYRGPGEHIFIVTDSDGVGGEAEHFFSRNGGSLWTLFTNYPFAADEDVGHVVAVNTRGGVCRVVESRITADASNPAEIGYSDVTFGNEAAAAWTNTDVGSTNTEIIEAMALLYYTGLYIAAGGDIYKSEDLGVSVTALYTGAVVVNYFAKGFGEDCRDVYAFGATNLILKENAGSGTFAALVGPAGGAAFGAAAIANNGLIFAGNATSLFVSYNDGLNAGGWTELNDFGGANSIKGIWLPEGDSQIIFVLVDDASDGEFWFSIDGGNSFSQVTSLSNSGYNAMTGLFEDHNKFYIVGEDNGGVGLVHQVIPATSGC